MFQIGELVMYGIHGACVVKDVEQRKVDRKNLEYLVLEPLAQIGARYFVPTHNEAALAKLRPVLSREELEALLHAPEVREDGWIEDENQRKQYYRELIASPDRTALLRMVRTLHSHKEAQLAAGRKFHLCDSNFLRDAQALLDAEFALVLGIPSQQVGEYVLQAMGE